MNDEQPTNVKFPDVTVVLTGVDGNAMSIVSAVTRALRREGHGKHAIAFRREALSGDYDNVIQTCMRWVNVE